MSTKTTPPVAKPTAKPSPMPTVTLTGSDAWMACSAREFGPVGSERHIVAPGTLTTVCGASATHADIWRRNTTKPRCRSCVTKYGTRQENR